MILSDTSERSEAPRLRDSVAHTVTRTGAVTRGWGGPVEGTARMGRPIIIIIIIIIIIVIIIKLY